MSMETRNYQGIEARVPVLDAESEPVFNSEQLDKQWGLVTEAIRQQVLSNPETRKLCAGFVGTPVSEELAEEFVTAMASADPRVAQLAARYRASLQEYLSLPAVPDEQVQPDIRNAPMLRTPERLIPELRGIYKDDITSYEESVQTHVRTGTFLKGITAQERLLVAKRYKYARDVKLLALQAELAQVGDRKQDFRAEVELPSGVKLGLDQSFAAARPELLNPAFWERRTQFKDRVYKIEVGGKSYLLKERKTNRHTDTKEHGHKDGLPSYDEFTLAQHLKDHGRAEQGRVAVDWERPVGYAVYPDGFSFTLFEYEQGLEGEEFTEHLAREIVAHKEQFAAEFALIAELAEKYKDSPEVNRAHGEVSESSLVSLLKWLKIKGATPGLSIEEFAKAKAYRMEQQARRLQRDVIHKAGYENSDGDGFAYKILTDKKLRLQIFGFDFEYFSAISKDRAQRLLKIEKEIDEESLQGIRFTMWSDRGGEVTRLQRAAYQALVSLEFGANAINEEE